jgi:hypothetical protein
LSFVSETLHSPMLLGQSAQGRLRGSKQQRKTRVVAAPPVQPDDHGTTFPMPMTQVVPTEHTRRARTRTRNHTCTHAHTHTHTLATTRVRTHTHTHIHTHTHTHTQGTTWDRSLVTAVAAAVAAEARAAGNDRGFSPELQVVTDPRFGRGQENFGADPLFVSEMGVAALKGLQGSSTGGPDE